MGSSLHGQNTGWVRRSAYFRPNYSSDKPARYWYGLLYFNIFSRGLCLICMIVQQHLLVFEMLRLKCSNNSRATELLMLKTVSICTYIQNPSYTSIWLHSTRFVIHRLFNKTCCSQLYGIESHKIMNVVTICKTWLLVGAFMGQIPKTIFLLFIDPHPLFPPTCVIRNQLPKRQRY